MVKKQKLKLGSFMGLLLLLSQLYASEITPTITANSSANAIAIEQSNGLALGLSLDSGNIVGHESDWWLVRQLSSQFASYDLNSQSWQNGLITTYQGPLFNFA